MIEAIVMCIVLVYGLLLIRQDRLNKELEVAAIKFAVHERVRKI